MNEEPTARETILNRVQRALAAHADSPLQPLPPAARFAPRRASTPDEEMERMLAEVERLNGHGRRVRGRDGFAAALEELIKAEGIRTAAFSDHPLCRPYGIGELLKGLGVEIISPQGDARRLATCDLGMTVADAALPETGSVLLRTTRGQADALSLLPRVHLALVGPEAFLADLQDAFALAKGDSHFVLDTGCSRTADIEKTLTLGVHGPKSYHLWICD
jgi:L-lactate dehydrogenase complex protein LldG